MDMEHSTLLTLAITITILVYMFINIQIIIGIKLKNIRTSHLYDTCAPLTYTNTSEDLCGNWIVFPAFIGSTSETQSAKLTHLIIPTTNLDNLSSGWTTSDAVVYDSSFAELNGTTSNHMKPYKSDFVVYSDNTTKTYAISSYLDGGSTYPYGYGEEHYDYRIHVFKLNPEATSKYEVFNN